VQVELTAVGHRAQVSTPQAEKQRGSKQGSAQGQNPGEDSTMMDVLENTLWNRQLGIMSEEIVAALVCQIFEGARRVCSI